MQFHGGHVKSVLEILSDDVEVQYVKSAGSAGNTLSLGVIDLKLEKSRTKYDLRKYLFYIFTSSLTGLLISGIVCLSA